MSNPLHYRGRERPYCPNFLRISFSMPKARCRSMGERIHSRRPARSHAAEHGYESMRKLVRLLIDQRTFIRVISSILARIIEGLMAGVLQIGLGKKAR